MTTLSLELAKELQSVCKEKNITMPEHCLGWFYQEITESNILLPMFSNSLSEYLAPAFLLDELMEWLPKSIEFITNIEYIKSLQWDNINNTWSAGYMNYEDWHCYQNDPNPANAACKLLIYLIKEGLL